MTHRVFFTEVQNIHKSSVSTGIPYIEHSRFTGVYNWAPFWIPHLTYLGLPFGAIWRMREFLLF